MVKLVRSILLFHVPFAPPMPAAATPQAAAAAVQRPAAAAAELGQLVGALRAALRLLAQAVPAGLQQCVEGDKSQPGTCQRLQQVQTPISATQRRREQRRKAAARSRAANETDDQRTQQISEERGARSEERGARSEERGARCEVGVDPA